MLGLQIDSDYSTDDNVIPFPFIVAPNDHYCLPRRRVQVSDNDGIQIQMPDKTSSLLWFPWPKSVEIPLMDEYINYGERAPYHHIYVKGNRVLQPRCTLCYGVSYKYSGIAHELEPETPPEIQRLIDVTAKWYGMNTNNTSNTRTSLVPMCLTNIYRSGYHYIGAHAVDERQFGELNDVICWVSGATRRLVVTENNGRVIIDAAMPEGIYIMQGRSFQQNYKHEIPREYDASFKHFCKVIDGITANNGEVAPITSLQKADWLLENFDEARNKIAQLRVHGRTSAELVSDFNWWARERVSHTIRFFKI